MASKAKFTALANHGDGTYHSMTDGARVEHPSIGHAMVHMASVHEPGMDHMHIGGTGEGYTAHHATSPGKVKGPKNVSSMAALQQHVAGCMEG